MPSNSINTNVSAMAALRSLNRIGTDLERTQGRIESGYKVGKASDDPAVFSIAQGMRADISGLKAVQDGLSFGKSAIGVANSAAKQISDELATLKQTITQGQQQGLDPNIMNSQITNALTNIDKYAQSATFNGVNLLYAPGGGAITSSNLTFLQDISGNKIDVQGSTVAADSASLGLSGLSVTTGAQKIAFDNSFEVANGDKVELTDGTNTWTFEFSDGSTGLTTTPTATNKVFDVQVDPTAQSNMEMVGALINKLKEQGFGASLDNSGALTISGRNATATTAFASNGATVSLVGGAGGAIATVDDAIKTLNTRIASLGATTRQVEGLAEFSKNLSDALSEGLGSLVDADLAEESARLQSLQTKQQLATQSLSIANQQPQSLLSLFR